MKKTKPYLIDMPAVLHTEFKMKCAAAGVSMRQKLLEIIKRECDAK